MREEKERAYRALIQQVRESYPAHCDDAADSPVRLEWCEDCKEINLWTYWQGRGHLDAKILLVGQDWGCPWNLTSNYVMENVRAMNRGEHPGYMTGNESITDKNLITLFREVGYDILSDDRHNEDLFFTNFVLGYRSRGISGGFRKAWARHDAEAFWRLVNILRPEKILCLGRNPFEGVLLAFQNHRLLPRMGAYNDFIVSEQNPIALPLENGQVLKIHALAHCGVLGTVNRNKHRDADKGASLDAQLRDWRRAFDR